MLYRFCFCGRSLLDAWFSSQYFCYLYCSKLHCSLSSQVSFEPVPLVLIGQQCYAAAREIKKTSFLELLAASTFETSWEHQLIQKNPPKPTNNPPTSLKKGKKKNPKKPQNQNHPAWVLKWWSQEERWQGCLKHQAKISRIPGKDDKLISNELVAL